MERNVAVVQRRAVALVDPLHHQRPGGHDVAVVEQRLDHQLKRLRRIELIDEQPPEGDVARRGAGLVPGVEGAGDEVGRHFDLLGDQPLDALDAGGGELVPPLRQPRQNRGEPLLERAVVDGRRFAPRAGGQVEDLLDQLDQLVDAPVVNRVFQRRKQAEVGREADDVPGVDQRAALDRPVQQLFDRSRDRRPPARARRDRARRAPR